MRKRIFSFAALISGVAILITSVLITIAAYNDTFEAQRREVRAEAMYARAGYELSGDMYLANLSYPSGHRLTVILQDGTVLYDSAETAAEMENHANRPEIIAALSSGIGESTRYSETIREQTYYYAMRLKDGSVLRVSSTTASMLASYDGLFWLVILIALCAFAIALAVAMPVTRRIVKPINEISLDYPERSVVYDEIIPLLKRIREQKNEIEEKMRVLEEGRREFSAITENMSEGFLVLDQSGKILSYNKSAMRILDTRRESAFRNNILALNRSEVFRKTVACALGGEAREQIIELAGHPCQLFASPVKEGDEVKGAVLLLLDVTEKQEREKLRREFTANVSHELKTPLTAISGYAEIMANGVAKQRDIPEFAQSIYREAQRLITLIGDLMFLSGLEENVPAKREPVELLALSQGASHRLTQKAQAHNVSVSVEGETAEILGIQSVLEEIIYNLIDNAIKYNREGGQVSVSVKTGEKGAILSVSDTGIGIPKAERERIFERFYRVDKSRNSEIPGTGLGLSIVKHGVMLHDAKIEVSSSDEGGSKFVIRF